MAVLVADPIPSVVSAPVGCLLIDRKGSIVFANELALKLFGYSKTELIGLSIDELVPDAVRRHHSEIRQVYWEKPEIKILGSDSSIPAKSKSGELIPVQLHLIPQAVGSEMQVAAWVFDMRPELMRKEKQLLLNNVKHEKRGEMITAILDHSPVPKILIDQLGWIRYANAAASKMFGYDVARLVGRSVEALIPVRFRGEHEGLRAQYLINPVPRAMAGQQELFAMRAGGAEFPVEIALNPLELQGQSLILATITDVSLRKQVETQMKILVENAPTPTLIIDQSGQIEYLNDAMAQLVNFSLRELQQKSINQLIPGFVEKLSAEKPLEKSGSKDRRRSDLWVWRRDGSRLPVYIDARQVPRGTAFYTVVAVTDIQALLHNDVLLDRARRLAEEAALAKTGFLATVSHEMRTPLNSIIGVAEMLQQSPLSDEQNELVRTISAGAESLFTLIEDLLDLSKFQAGIIRLSEKATNSRDLINSAIVMMRERAEEKNLDLSLDVSEEVPKELLIDGSRVRQVLVNLIGNAIKFTARGSVTVKVRCVDNTGQNTLEFEVADTGIGIAPEKFPRLFQPFSQIDPEIQARYGGAGLGLVISQRIAEAMGGGISVHSEPGVGSVFTLRFNAAEAAPTHQLPTVSPSDLKDCRKLRILVAEDNPINQRVAQLMLARLGQAVTSVVNGEEAVAACRDKHFEIVFMDLNMPVMDGLTATKHIRESIAEANQPHIIAMTANVMHEDKLKCREVGMDDFLEKPINLKSLSEVLVRSGLLNIAPLPNASLPQRLE